MKIQNAVLLLLLTLVSCGAHLKDTDFADSIEKCSYQNWVSGVRNGGQGINFFIDLKHNLPPDSQLVKVQFQKHEAAIVPIDSLHFAAYIILKKGGNNVAENESSDEIETQLENDQAKIFYRLNGKDFNMIVKPSEQEMVPYP